LSHTGRQSTTIQKKHDRTYHSREWKKFQHLTSAVLIYFFKWIVIH
jgi:hypothetical protein